MKRINVTRTKPMNEKTNPSGPHLESSSGGLDGPNRYKTIHLLLTTLFAALLAAQILFLIRCNLTDIINYVDSDMGMGLYHFREMIRNHTIDLPGYTNTTTLEVDTSFLLAVPFYLLTRNFSLSVGLSNICIIAAYAAIVRGIMAELGTKRVYRIITLILVFTPYAIGMLDYLNMMFLGLACYSIKTMVPLLGVWFLLMKGEHPIRRGAVLALYSVLLFITTMSTGVYVMLSGIAPILLFGAVRMWQEDSVFLLKDKAKVVWGGHEHCGLWPRKRLLQPAVYGEFQDQHAAEFERPVHR